MSEVVRKKRLKFRPEDREYLLSTVIDRKKRWTVWIEGSMVFTCTGGTLSLSEEANRGYTIQDAGTPEKALELRHELVMRELGDDYVDNSSPERVAAYKAELKKRK
jgi:hypothetical protein